MCLFKMQFMSVLTQPRPIAVMAQRQHPAVDSTFDIGARFRLAPLDGVVRISAPNGD